MEEEEKRVASPSTEVGLAEEGMVGQELVREMIARRKSALTVSCFTAS